MEEEESQKLHPEEDTLPTVVASTDSAASSPSGRPPWLKRYLGILLALCASLLFPLTGLLVKTLVKTYHPFNVAFWRFQGILLPAIPMALCRPSAKKDGKKNKNIFAPITSGEDAAQNRVLLVFYSLRYITIADSSVISFSTPVWVTLLAHVTLGEACSVMTILAGVLSLAGVLIISRPPMLTGQESWDGDTLIGVALALGCMVCATSTFVILRRLRTMSYALLNLFFGIWGSLETLFLSALIWTFSPPMNWWDGGLAIALGVLSFISQLCMTLSFKYETAGVISLIRTLDVIFTFIWQYLVFQVVPDRFSVIGAIIVLTGIGLVGVRKWLTELDPQDPRRKRFALLLI
ncbi:hypothetical protein Fcan01_14188 [Folsomia candida]|uniref:EamA domain-containing protein n=1 Tax=Folsomia candida TaxID=158441 RepID=A0A226E0L0_FOLCA|nr:hypothetical protein Fcan01_14188 [Folsomia candida]